jgi:hypothetical protein
MPRRAAAKRQRILRGAGVKTRRRAERSEVLTQARAGLG